MDRITSLTVFVKVVECTGFSAAGRRLNMSTTMVSNHVQSLEDRLGARLLNRTTRKLSLTEIGKAYYARAIQILADIEEADRIADALQATPRGTLRLHMSMNIVRFLAPIISEFLILNPAVAVDVSVGERMVDIVEDGYDLVIRTLPPPESEFIVRQLTPWHHILCCSPAYLETHPAPRDLADLVHHNCLRFAYYPFGDEWRFDGPDRKPVSIRVRGNLVTSSGETLRLIGLAGHGIVLAPTFMVVDDLAFGRLVRVLPQHRGVELAISAIYPHRHNLSAKVRSFIDLLAERFTEHRKWMNP